MPENENNNSNENEQNENPSQQDPPSAPPTNSGANEIAIAHQLARNAIAQAEAARRETSEIREQNERLQRGNNRPAELNMEELNEQIRNGNAAQAFQQIMRHDQAAALAPLHEEVGLMRRERNIGAILDQVLRNYQELIPFRANLFEAIKVNLGSAEPTYNFVELIVKAVVGDAQIQSARMPRPANAVAQPNNNPPSPQNQPPMNLPPNVPNGRPAPRRETTPTLTESQKRLRDKIAAGMPDAEFLTYLDHTKTPDAAFSFPVLFPEPK